MTIVIKYFEVIMSDKESLEPGVMVAKWMVAICKEASTRSLLDIVLYFTLFVVITHLEHCMCQWSFLAYNYTWCTAAAAVSNHSYTDHLGTCFNLNM